MAHATPETEFCGYLLMVVTLKHEAQVLLAMLNFAEKAHSIAGGSTETEHKQLWVIPAGPRVEDERFRALQDIPAVQLIQIAAFSKPVRKAELRDLLELLAAFGWDASGVTREELSNYLDAEAQADRPLYIDVDWKGSAQLKKIRIRQLSDHPAYSPDWMKVKTPPASRTSGKALTLDDLESQSIKFVSTEDDPQ